MKINRNTKISTLIKVNTDVIDAIVSINKHFEKLRNPILRKLFASSVTIADSAKIGGTSIQIFYDKLMPSRFYCESDDVKSNTAQITVPDFYQTLTPKNTRKLDAMDDIAKGKDPLK